MVAEHCREAGLEMIAGHWNAAGSERLVQSPWLQEQKGCVGNGEEFCRVSGKYKCILGQWWKLWVCSAETRSEALGGHCNPDYHGVCLCVPGKPEVA